MITENNEIIIIDTNEPRGHCSACNCSKLDVTNWLKDLPKSLTFPDIVEIRFKNTRKEFFRNTNELPLKEGDIVAVEASPGHDIGIVSITGELVLAQMRKLGIQPTQDMKKIYRKAKDFDIEKWNESAEREDPVMIKSRKIAQELNLNMKISDVEFQGDGSKAIFYYIAEQRVDFRELIRILADQFKIRVEMRQIGARQEAGRVGGVGPCGRELCCSSWMSAFKSVSTTSARHQELSLNPLKLAGQCGKLKCCLNFELESYIDAKKAFPLKTTLEVKGGKAIYLKSDIHKGLMWYSAIVNDITNIIPLTIEQVKDIIEQNKDGKKPDISKTEEVKKAPVKHGFEDVIEEESLTRFDKAKKTKKRKNKKKKNPNKPEDKNSENNSKNDIDNESDSDE